MRNPFLFAVDFKGESGFVLSPDEADKEGILFDISGKGNFRTADNTRIFDFSFLPPKKEIYKKAFEKIQNHLKNGDTYLVNLTFPSALETDLSLDEFFSASHAPFRLLVPGHFVVFSPEPFVEIKNGLIYSRPMKGTINASVNNAERILLDDEKEFFEHNTIVDLIRNDISMVATEVHVIRFRYIERINTNRSDLLQMSSEISGKLPDDYLKELGDIIFRLLPAGSITGAPKERTVQIIGEAENCDRGFYTGIFGYFNGYDLNSAVCIRFIEQKPEGLYFRSGGGITAMSDLDSEYNELISKIYVPVI